MEQDYRPSKDLRDALVIISSTTTALGTNLTLTDSVLTEGDDYWNNMAVVILSGNSIGQIRRISDFDAASDTITVDTVFASVIASGTKYNIVAQHSPTPCSTLTQAQILSDATPFAGANIANLDAAISTRSIMAATDIGVRQVFEKTITANADSGPQILGTITTQACVIESIIIHANAALPVGTTCPVTGAAGVITFIDAGVAIAATLNAADTQVSWTSGGSGGVVRLAAAKTIITTLAGGGANPTNITFIITYYSSSANGGTIT